MIKVNNLINFENSILLKNINYDIPSIYHYSRNGMLMGDMFSGFHKFDSHYSAPTVFDLNSWICDKYDYYVEIKTPDGKEGGWISEVHKVNSFGSYYISKYCTNEIEAYNDALNYILSVLINKN